jgi:YidC/Oxa1 family membrane protein insertase
METQRLMLLIALGLVSFLLWNAWQEQFNPSPIVASPKVTQVDDGTAAVPMGAEEGGIPQSQAIPVASGMPKLKQGQQIIVETDTFKVVIDTKGGDLRQADLIKYPVSIKEPDVPFRLLSSDPDDIFIVQSGFAGKSASDDGSIISAPNHKTVYQAEQTRYVLNDDEDKLNVDLFWVSPEGVRFTKRYIFSRNSHLIQLQHIIKNQTGSVWRGNLYQQIQRSGNEVAMGIGTTYTYTGGVVWSEEEKYQKISFGDMRDENFKEQVEGGWLAMIQHYFVTALVPDKALNYNFYSQSLKNNRLVLGMSSVNETRLAPGEEIVLNNQLYVGPKSQHVLADIAEGLELTVDYGFLTIIAKPIYWLLEFIHGFVNNWGWSIILLTMSIKLVFYKLSETSYKSMANMRKLTPRIQKLKERYGDDKQKLQQAQMKMFKEEKINPLGGCLPILVQIPVFISLYWVLLESVELRQAPWILWITDLSIKDPYFVLPVLMGISMLIQQKLNPPPTDPMQAKVMMALPFVFTIFFLFFPAGLVLYWVVNNVLSITQQYYITKVVIKA